MMESAETQRYSEGGGKPKTKQKTQTKWRGREDMKNVQEPHGVFVCCGCVVVEGL